MRMKLLLLVTALSAVLIGGVILSPAAAGESAAAAASHRDAAVVSFGKPVVIDHPVNGNVQVVLGSVMVNSLITGDLAVFGGNIRFGKGGRVTGDVVSFGGGITGAGAGSVGGELIAFASSTPRLREDSSVGPLARAIYEPASLVALAIKVALMIVWFLVALLLAFTNGREIRYSAVELRVSPFHTFALGLVAFTSFVLTAVLFTYLVPFLIGIPLLVLLGLVAVLTKVYGMIAVFHLVGSLLAGPRTSEDVVRRKIFRGDMAMVLVGVLVLGAVRLIPIVGDLIWIGASLFGIGVALATKFGRREPWFLAWRPAVSE
ncbi:MAG: hypothetical protein ABI718_08845 [Acidobacteriota bacterium]